MAEPEIEKRSDRADPITIAAVATKRTSQTSGTNGATSPAEKPAPDALTRDAADSKPPDYLDDALKHAERLLKYAAETGIHIEQASISVPPFAIPSCRPVQPAATVGMSERLPLYLRRSLTSPRELNPLAPRP